jgi:hypothetical protein
VRALREMIQAARDSAALHELKGEHAEAERWAELAERWEARAEALEKDRWLS